MWRRVKGQSGMNSNAYEVLTKCYDSVPLRPISYDTFDVSDVISRLAYDLSFDLFSWLFEGLIWK